MKPIDIYTLKKLLWQNLDNKKFSDFCTDLGIDVQKLRGKGIIEKSNYLVDLMITNGKGKLVFDLISNKVASVEENYYFDDSLFLPNDALLEDPSLIPVPPEQIGERIIQPKVDDPNANALLRNIDELYGKLEDLADPTDQEELFNKLQQAGQILRKNWEENEYWGQVGRAEFLIRIVATHITRLQKLRDIRIRDAALKTEDDKLVKKNEFTLSWAILLIFIIYTFLTTVLTIIVIKNGLAYSAIPVIEVPYSVLVWSSIGSLSAQLYRYYKREKRSQMVQEIRLAIGRFWIGLVAGSVFYFAVRSGLFLLSNQALDLNNLPTGQQQIIWVLVWIVSFSDFTFEKVVTKISGNVVGDESDQALSSILGAKVTDIGEAIERANSRQLEKLRTLQAEINNMASEIRTSKNDLHFANQIEIQKQDGEKINDEEAPLN